MTKKVFLGVIVIGCFSFAGFLMAGQDQQQGQGQDQQKSAIEKTVSMDFYNPDHCTSFDMIVDSQCPGWKTSATCDEAVDILEETGRETGMDVDAGCSDIHESGFALQLLSQILTSSSSQEGFRLEANLRVATKEIPIAKPYASAERCASAQKLLTDLGIFTAAADQDCSKSAVLNGKLHF